MRTGLPNTHLMFGLDPLIALIHTNEAAWVMARLKTPGIVYVKMGLVHTSAETTLPLQGWRWQRKKLHLWWTTPAWLRAYTNMVTLVEIAPNYLQCVKTSTFFPAITSLANQSRAWSCNTIVLCRSSFIRVVMRLMWWEQPPTETWNCLLENFLCVVV